MHIFLSRKTIMASSDGRRNLASSVADTGLCIDAGMARDWELRPSFMQHGNNVPILGAVVCVALYPQAARVDSELAKYDKVASGAVARRREARDLKLRRQEMKRLFIHPE